MQVNANGSQIIFYVLFFFFFKSVLQPFTCIFTFKKGEKVEFLRIFVLKPYGSNISRFSVYAR